MHVAFTLALLAAIQAAGASEIIVLENASDRDFEYRLNLGFDPPDADRWTATLTIPAHQRRTIGSAVPLVISFRDGGEWKSNTLSPGGCFDFALDNEGHGELVEVDAPTLPAPKLREIKVLAVADIEYRNRFPEWEQRVRDLVAASSRFYESEFGLRFTVVACKPWEFNARYQQTMEEKLVSLQKIELGQADLMIAFVRSIQPIKQGDVIGWGFLFCEYMLVTDRWPELADIVPLMPLPSREILRKSEFGSTITLVHELAHLLGAFHVDNRESIMCASTVRMIPPRIQFDEINRQVILATREVDFRAGPDSVPRSSALKLRELYRAHHLAAEPVDNDPITAGYRWRAVLAAISQNRPLAGRLILRSATWWRDVKPSQPAAGDAKRAARRATEIERVNALLASGAMAKPVFPSTSSEPVLLRYRFRSGESFPIGLEAKAGTELAGAAGSRTLGGTTRICGECEVKSAAADGNAELVLTVTRVTVADKALGDRAIDVGRDGDEGKPVLVPLGAMINRPLVMTVSPTGRVLRCDARAVADEVRRRGGDLALQHLGRTLDLVVKNAFLRVPEDPVKPGDSFDPGDHRAKLPDGGEILTTLSCTLSGVSADRKAALLDLVSRKSYYTPGRKGAEVALEQAALNGWILFDLDSGKVARLTWQFANALTVSDGSKSTKIKNTNQTTYVRAQEPPPKQP